MSKMQEAWDNWQPEQKSGFRVATVQEGFEAGYQAALADVKAGGAVGRVRIGTYPFVADTYRLPEDV